MSRSCRQKMPDLEVCKLRKSFITILVVAMIMATALPGHCYTNTVALKTTDCVSEYESMVWVGMSTGKRVGLSTGVVLGSGFPASVGTYLVIQATPTSQAVAAAAAFQTVTVVNPAVGDAATESAVVGFTMNYGADFFAEYAASHAAGAAAGGSPVASVASPFLVAGVAALVVIIVTAIGVYVIWSLS
jgi:hypothetical protein